MRIEEIKNLKEGTRYNFTALEENRTTCELYNEDYSNAEYRGKAYDEGYLLFAPEGETRAREFHYNEISNVKKSK